MICLNHKRCSPRPSVDKKKLKLPLPFSAALRGPPRTKRSCPSSRSFAVLRGQKEVAVAVLRGPSWSFVDKKKLPLPFFAVLRGPSRTKGSCRCRSSRPSVALRGQKEVAVALLRGPSRSFADKRKLPLPFFAALRSQKRCSSRSLAERPNSNPANLQTGTLPSCRQHPQFGHLSKT